MRRISREGSVLADDFFKRHDILTISEEELMEQKEPQDNNFCQWTLGANNTFFPAVKTVKKITPGVYEIEDNPQSGLFFRQIEMSISDLIKFDDSECDEIVADVKKFWTLKEAYNKIKQDYKRGYLLHGAGGTGKSSCLRLVVQNLIELGGVSIKFNNPYTFSKGMHSFRKIEPERPLVVLMEDVEAIIEEYSESEVLNILDGVSSLTNVIYLATTNYPDKLLGRVTNRPSRFDRVFEFKAPGIVTRRTFLKSLIDKHAGNLEIDIEKWVRETKDLSIAHLKELFISIAVFGYDYDKTLKTLVGMKKTLKASEESSAEKVGF